MNLWRAHHNSLLHCLAQFWYLSFSPSQEEASRDQADRKGSEDMEVSEAELAAEEGKIFLLCPGEGVCCLTVGNACQNVSVSGGVSVC